MSFETFELIAGYPTIDKSPTAELDFYLNLADWLKPFRGRLTFAAVAAVDGVTAGPAIIQGDKIAVWISGSSAVGNMDSVTLSFTALGADGKPRSDTRTLKFRIKPR